MIKKIKFIIFIILVIYQKILIANDSNLFSDSVFISKSVSRNLTTQNTYFDKFEKPIVPNLVGIQDFLYQIIKREGLKGEPAFFFLKAVCELNTINTLNYKYEIYNQLDNYELSHEQKVSLQEIIFNYGMDSIAKSLSFKVKSNNTPVDLINNVINTIEKLPVFTPNKAKSIEAITFLKSILFFGIDDSNNGSEDNEYENGTNCYNNDPECIHSSNEGLINYISDQLIRDEVFLKNSINFYLLAYQRQINNRVSEDDLVFSKEFKDNMLWNDVMSKVNNNPFQALRVISVFFHDECCNSLYAKSELNPVLELLNNLFENFYFGYFAPGSLAGLESNKYYQFKFSNLKKRYKKILNEDTEFYYNNYHFFGGVFIANELLRKNYSNINGLNFPIFINEVLGYYYKKVTMDVWMDEDVKYLWKNIVHENPYIIPVKPLTWSFNRFKKASLRLEMLTTRILFTAEQHYNGAKFVFDIYKKNTN